MTWKLIKEYPCTVGENFGPIVLGRLKDVDGTWRHYLVFMKNGHFNTLPQQWFWYVDHHKYGPCYCDNVEEFMEIPE